MRLSVASVVGVLAASLLAPGSATGSPADRSTFVANGACTSASVTSDKASPQPGGTVVTFTATAGGCASPLFQWWLWSPLSGWVMRTNYLSSNTFSLSTAGLEAGTYSVDVWVENSGSSLGRGGYETFGLEAWVVGDCDYASLTPNPAPTTGMVHFVASAGGVGCTTPIFQWWLHSSATGWVVVQPYSSSSTYDLDTSTLSNTDYTVDVWVKESGSAAIFYDTWALSTVPKGACGTSTMNAIQTSPQPVGIGVDLSTDTAPLCVTPQFRYWAYRGPIIGWEIERGYIIDKNFTLNTDSWTPGTYSLDVWVSFGTGSIAPYDTYALLSYTLTGTTTAGVSTTPGSPHVLGGPVTINATSSGSPAPQYEFFVYDNVTAVWTTVQAYSTSASATWTPAHTGTYAIVVHVKQTGSGSLYDTYAMVSYSAT